MSLIRTCIVCDQRIPNPYSGDACCGGTGCARFEGTEDERLTVSQRDPLKRERRAA